MVSTLLCSPQTMRVMIADDHRDTVDSCTLLLRMDGHETLGVYNGPDAIHHAPLFRPDILLLDLAMPDMDGYSVAHTIREMPIVQQPVMVAVTGHADSKTRLRCAEAGFDLHVSKPIDYTSFVRCAVLIANHERLSPKPPERVLRSLDSVREFMRAEVKMAHAFLDLAITTSNGDTKQRCMDKAEKAQAIIHGWISETRYVGDDELLRQLAELDNRFRVPR